ncbi:RNA methyltransferase [Hyphomonas sp.]|uniref:TrmH family RNA methyltransferase n=1 Tax=Hyphomonas sp. TaxID=87 RepID=UPI0032EEA232
MPLFTVQHADDPRLAAYTSIREKDLTAGHGGRFIVEGKVTLATLVTRSRFAVESLFLCETRLEPLADLLAHVPEAVPVYVAPQDVMDAVAGFPIHRGVLACGLKGATGTNAARILSDISQEKPLTSTLLMLSDLSNHDNVGACFRNAAAFGADAVLLDGQCCDPLYRKAIRVSSGASLWLPFAHGGSGDGMVRAAQDAGYTVWAMTPHAGAAPIGSVTVPGKLAILLGAEGPGLPDDLISAAQPVGIPMSAGSDSVNVATAGAIAMAHAFAARAG